MPFFTDERLATIERLARAMCDALGQDPDETVPATGYSDAPVHARWRQHSCFAADFLVCASALDGRQADAPAAQSPADQPLTGVFVDADLEFAGAAAFGAPLRLWFSLVEPVDDTVPGRLPPCLLPLGSGHAIVGHLRLDPLGIVRGRACYEATALHPAGDPDLPPLPVMRLARALSPERHEWPPAAAAFPAPEHGST